METYPTPEAAGARAAREIGAVIAERNRCGSPTVLGLATGATMVPVYRALVRELKRSREPLGQVHTFNLDEYWPMDADHPASFHAFMDRELFRHLDLPAAQCHLPNGGVPRDGIDRECARYEAAIRELGGIDLQLLGIGRNGHVGFNEPGAAADSRTRLVDLSEDTRRDAAPRFPTAEDVPRQAITVGMAGILSARRVVLLATGERKAAAVRRAFEEAPRPDVPASLLQGHPGLLVLLDEAAASELRTSRRVEGE